MDGNFIKINSTVDYFNWKDTRFYYEENGIRYPVLNPVLVHKDMIQPNDYNPNHVAKDKMELLKTSIVQNGFAFGIVSIFDCVIEKFVIIDGYHRDLITGKDWLNLTYKPLIILEHDMSKRLSATVQFNKARGVHRIEGNAELIKRMVDVGVKDIDICKALGIDADELLRLKRLKKIAEVYKDREYSNSWEILPKTKF